MSELQDYISGLSGKEIDAAILLIMQKFIRTFNGRSGFDVKPAKGDYKTDMILDGSSRPEGYGFPDDVVSLETILVKIYDVLVKIHEHQLKHQFHRDLLAGDSSRLSGTIELAHSWKDYDYLEFWGEQGNASRIWKAENVVCYLPTEFIKEHRMHNNGNNFDGAFLMYGYSSEYNDIDFPSDTQMHFNRINGMGYYRIYGIKFIADFEGFE